LAEDNILELSIGIVGALFGSGASLVGTVMYDNKRTRDRESEIRRVSQISLLNECRMNRELMVSNQSIDSIFLYDSVFHSLVSSGNLALFESKYQTDLQELYSLIKRNNDIVSSYTTLISLSQHPSVIDQNLKKVLRRYKKKSKTGLQELNPQNVMENTLKS
jgi:hypothetical protein